MFAQIAQTFPFLQNFHENHPTLVLFPKFPPFFKNSLFFFKAALRNAHCFWNICPKTNIFAQNLGSIRENLLESHDNKIFSHNGPFVVHVPD
jgi:hypothetical protein